jgi:hypothetical protein
MRRCNPLGRRGKTILGEQPSDRAWFRCCLHPPHRPRSDRMLLVRTRGASAARHRRRHLPQVTGRAGSAASLPWRVTSDPGARAFRSTRAKTSCEKSEIGSSSALALRGREAQLCVTRVVQRLRGRNCAPAGSASRSEGAIAPWRRLAGGARGTIALWRTPERSKEAQLRPGSSTVRLRLGAIGLLGHSCACARAAGDPTDAIAPLPSPKSRACERTRTSTARSFATLEPLHARAVRSIAARSCGELRPPTRPATGCCGADGHRAA